MDSSLALENKSLRMEIDIKVNISILQQKDMESITGRMAVCIREILSKELGMGMVFGKTLKKSIKETTG